MQHAAQYGGWWERGGGAHLEDEQGGERRPEHVQQLSQLPTPRTKLCTRENEAWKP